MEQAIKRQFDFIPIKIIAVMPGQKKTAAGIEGGVLCLTSFF